MNSFYFIFAVAKFVLIYYSVPRNLRSILAVASRSLYYLAVTRAELHLHSLSRPTAEWSQAQVQLSVVDVSNPALKGNRIDAFLVSLICPSPCRGQGRQACLALQRRVHLRIISTSLKFENTISVTQPGKFSSSQT